MLMRASTHSKGWAFGFLCGICVPSIAWCVARAFGPDVNAEDAKNSTVENQVAKESPAYRGLDASLFMQTSGEYRACCIQAFQWAERIVAERLVADGLDSPGANAKPMAVVFDLDETVLDNGRFQTEQIRSGNAFDSGLWSQWEQTGGDELEAIPGAVEFIRKLESHGIQRFYITNRNVACHAQTLAALSRLGIGIPGDQLLCASEETGTNKTKRRETAESRFDVLLYIGDNLRDFDEVFRCSDQVGIVERKNLVDDHKRKFGRKWIILPNPAYGEWLKPQGRGESDANQLLPRL